MELQEKILAVAASRDDIRGVILNGSRANPAAIADEYRDYDVVYVVTDTAPFLDGAFLSYFGTPLLSQCPDLLDASLGKPTRPSCRRGWLLQFDKTNRLDLHVMTLGEARNAMRDEYYIEVLSDKDGALGSLTAKSLQRPLPSEAVFLWNVNEFHWLFVNIFKGIRRDEIPYVTEMMEKLVRPLLRDVLVWSVLIKNPHADTGKFAKRLKDFLPAAQWESYKNTYSLADVTSAESAAVAMLRLYAEVAPTVASALGYPYTGDENRNALSLFDR